MARAFRVPDFGHRFVRPRGRPNVLGRWILRQAVVRGVQCRFSFLSKNVVGSLVVPAVRRYEEASCASS